MAKYPGCYSQGMNQISASRDHSFRHASMAPTVIDEMKAKHHVQSIARR